MFVIKGFAPHANLADNALDIINPVGELSSIARTYSLDRGKYINKAIAPDSSLLTFMTQEDGVFTQLSPVMRDEILEITNHIYNFAISQAGTQLDAAEYEQELINTFSSRIIRIAVGAIENDGAVWMPEWVRWDSRSIDSDIRIWFSDRAFRTQYPEALIKVVTPFDRVDDFFLPVDEVKTKLNGVTRTMMAERIQEVIANKPATLFRVDEFDYVNLQNPTDLTPAPFGVVMYGISKNNMDSIKDAIAEYLLANSTRPRDDWAAILPDIFKRTEFVIVPVWNHIAIPNQVQLQGIYSPQMTFQRAINVLRAYVPYYSPSHVSNAGMMTRFPFRAVTMLSIGSVENRNGKFLLSEYFPDWIGVSSTHSDFNRQTKNTRDWHLKLAEAIGHAENFEEYSEIPEGFMKVVREDRLHLSFSHENVNFNVLCKTSMPE